MKGWIAKPDFLADLDLERSGGIEASAGTGKTYAVEHLVLELVLRGLPFDQILLITFTDKAASELKVRLRQLLMQLPGRILTSAPEGPAWKVDGALEARRVDALHRLGRAQISTIHAFCRRMLQEFAFEGRRPFELELVDEAVTLRAAARRVLRRPADTDAARFVLTWLRTVPVHELTDRWVQWALARAEIEPRFDLEAWRALHADWRLGLPTLRALMAAIPRLALPRPAAKALRNALQILCRGGLEADLARALSSLDEVDSLLPRLERHASALQDASPRAWTLVQRLMARVPFEAAGAQVILPELWEEEARLKADRGWQTFSDMTSGLDAALGPALIARMRERFRICIVDEFQDTDEIQWRILKRVFFESTDHRLVVVGDPKQSIYGFRGADLHTYREATDAIHRAGGFRLRLERTYRSTPGVTDAVHMLLSARGHSFWSGQLDYAPVRSAVEPRTVSVQGRSEPALTVWRFEADRLEDGVGTVRRAWARAIATDAARLIDGGRVSERPVRPGDLFVLTRTAAEGRLVASTLRRANLPVQLFERGGLEEALESRAARDLLAAVERPDDAAAERRAWLTPWFGLEPHALPSAVELPASHPWLEELAELRAQKRSAPPHRLLGRLARHPRLHAACAEHPARYGEVDAYETLFDELVRVADRGGWSAVFERLDQDATADRAPAGEEAIRVSTIHGAKGLEAECVYLFGGLKRGRRGAVRVRRPDGWRLALDAPPEAETAWWEEEERLAYVALTRARSRLVLAWFDDPEEAFVEGPYAVVQRSLNVRVGEGLPTAPLPAPSRGLALPSAPPAVDVPRPGLPRWPDARPSLRITSYSELKRRPGDADEPPAPLLPAVEDELPGGAQMGKCLHHLLETADWTQVERTPDARAWAESVSAWLADGLRRFGVDARWSEACAELVHRTLRRPLDLFGRPTVLCREPAIREMDFVFRFDEREDVLIRGFVDVLLDVGDGLVLLDYKSDRLPDYEPDRLRAHVEAHYTLQADLYACGMELHRQTLGSDRPVIGSGFLFLRAPEDGLVLRAHDEAAARARVREAMTWLN